MTEQKLLQVRVDDDAKDLTPYVQNYLSSGWQIVAVSTYNMSDGYSVVLLERVK